MWIKFDGIYVKDEFKTITNLTDGKILREGQSSGGKALGNIKSEDIFREKDSSGGKTLYNVKDEKNIRDGQSSGGKQLIKISDASKKIGASSHGPSTALVWCFFAR